MQNLNQNSTVPPANQNMTNFVNRIPHATYYCQAIYLQITTELEILKVDERSCADLINKLRLKQEQTSLMYHNYQKIISGINYYSQLSIFNNQLQAQSAAACLTTLNGQKAAIEQELNQHFTVLQESYSSITNKVEENVEKKKEIMLRILDQELAKWQRNQQYSGHDGDCDLAHLDVLQNWLGTLAEIISSGLTCSKEAIRCIKQFFPASDTVQRFPVRLQKVHDTTVRLLKTIIFRCLVIEKQPPQVMKTKTRFSAKLRHLIADRLGMHLHLPQVKVSIISEAQAYKLLTEKILDGRGCGDILNNTGSMEFDPATRQLAVIFRNMQLKDIKRAEKKGTESVVDEKFALYFSTSITIREYNIKVWCISLPVTVTVHGNQESHAWATITWDNAVADVDRKPFVVPDRMYWRKIAAALNLKFTSMTGNALTTDNVRYLAEKLFRKQQDEYDTMQISWVQFCKEALPERNFTFWDWFYAIMKLIREHLKTLWIEELIMGFVRKKEAEELLSNCQIGTFLLRFSDSELGGITIAWVEATGVDTSHVVMLQPFTAKDFQIRCLPDRINDLSQLQTLYPNVSKQEAFGKFYTQYENMAYTTSNGYRKRHLVTHVPSWNSQNSERSLIGPGGLISEPQTPGLAFQTNSPVETFPLANVNTGFVGDPFCPSSDMEYEFGDVDLQQYNFPNVLL